MLLKLFPLRQIILLVQYYEENRNKPDTKRRKF
jgi:hypothetical protein